LNIEKDKTDSLNMLYNAVYNNKLDLIDHTNIKDWYLYKFWEVMYDGTKEEISVWCEHLEHLERIMHELSGRMKLNRKVSRFETIFFTQLQLLIIRFDIPRYCNNITEQKERFEKSLIETKKKLKVYNS